MARRPSFIDVVGRVVNANVRFHREMGRLTLRFLEDAAGVGVETVRTMADAVAGRGHAPPRERDVSWGRGTGTGHADAHANAHPPSHQDVPGRSPKGQESALVLEGNVGELALGVFMVENTLGRPIATGFTASPFQTADGRHGPQELIFEPEIVRLDPGQQMLVRVGVPITDDLPPEVSFRGAIAVSELPGTNVGVVVRRRLIAPHASGDAEAGDERAAPPTSGEESADPHDSHE